MATAASGGVVTNRFLNTKTGLWENNSRALNILAACFPPLEVDGALELSKIWGGGGGGGREGERERKREGGREEEEKKKRKKKKKKKKKIHSGERSILEGFKGSETFWRDGR